AYLANKYLVPVGFLGGDYNGDGVVDAGDYVMWRDNLGQFLGLQNENPYSITEGFVDREDYDYWVANYGNTSSSTTSNAVLAEPGTSLLAEGLLLIGAIWRRRRRPSGHSW
ncbi:MAG TPA: hypothetical protein PKC18_04340, partial [Lacipirellulaceae bacterium]|nr:hypothetical protein [Lacipirellulaceae bacterium]